MCRSALKVSGRRFEEARLVVAFIEMNVPVNEDALERRLDPRVHRPHGLRER